MTVLLHHRQASLAPAVSAAILAMVAIQLAAALSRPLVAEIGAPAVTWLRMATAAAILMIVTRPNLRGLDRQSLSAALMLGAALAVMAVSYFAAVSRLPLGLASTIAFLGPFSIALFAARGRVAIALALPAGLGVLLTLDPWSQGMSDGWTADPEGIAFAALSAAGFAAYILLTRRVGLLFRGTDGMTISLLTAAVLLTPFGVAGMDEMPSPSVVFGSASLAVLAPLATCWLEMSALRKLGSPVFSVLLSLEPAIAAVLGVALLVEVPNLLQTAGITCVVFAAIAVVRTEPEGQ